jgi:glyoxylase-like metal-dependent hydrolase (beta-lactamase superfamily II)
MTRTANTYRIGDATITRIDELTLNAFPPAALYPGSDPAAWERNKGRFGKGSSDIAAGVLIQSIHTWLVKTPHHTILIDTATGNGKARPYAPVLDQLNEPFLERLAAAGVQPEAVDYILLTHVHADHVGWNTRLVDERWVPTFRNAKYVFSGIERAYNEALSEGKIPTGEASPDPKLGTAVGTPSPGVYDDSMRPIIEAGLAEIIKVDGNEMLDGLSFLPSPGHSIDHASIRLVSRGEEALFAGDVMHHPLQVYEPALNSCFCEFPEPSRSSRLWALEHAAEYKSVFFSTHFAESSAGRVTRKGDRFEWQFI